MNMNRHQLDQYQNLTISKMRKLVRHCTELINRQMLLDGSGIAYEQFPLLIAAIHLEGSSMQEIARITKQDKAGILRGLRALELRGFITFRSDPHDMRKRLVFSTRKARELSKKIVHDVHAFEQGLLRGIPARDLRTFFSVAGTLTDKCIALGATKLPRYGGKKD